MLKTKIDYGSLVKEGLPKRKEDFEVALICGKMGSGKNYWAFYKSFKLKRDVKTNVHSFHSLSFEVSYFNNLSEVYDDSTPNLLYIVDECSKRFPKECRADQNFLSWLYHSRKCNRYVYLIFQDYLMVPQWIRCVADHVYITSKMSFLPLHRTDYGVPFLDPETKEWSINILSSLIYKRNKFIADSYDTNEVIHEL